MGSRELILHLSDLQHAPIKKDSTCSRAATPGSHRMATSIVSSMYRSGEFWPVDPKACSNCRTTITLLLQKCYVDPTKPEFHHICRRWLNIQKLASSHCHTTSWAELVLAHMLSFGWTSKLLVGFPSLQSLLQDLQTSADSLSGLRPFIRGQWHHTSSC